MTRQRGSQSNRRRAVSKRLYRPFPSHHGYHTTGREADGSNDSRTTLLEMGFRLAFALRIAIKKSTADVMDAKQDIEPDNAFISPTIAAMRLI